MAVTVRVLLVSLPAFAFGLLCGWYAHQVVGRLSTPAVTTAALDPATHTSNPAPSPDAGSRPPIASLERLFVKLNRQRLEAAVALYVDLLTEGHPEIAAQARAMILEHARTLIDSGQADQAVHLLNLFREHSYRDREALDLSAFAYAEAGDEIVAITTLYEVRALAHRPEDLAVITRRIRERVSQYVHRAEIRDDRNSLLELYLMLTRREPQFAPYFLELGRVQRNLGDTVGARQSLELVVQDAEVGARARALLSALEIGASPDNEGISVPLRGGRDRFVVGARLNNRFPLALLLDTGATLTILKPSAVRALGVDPESAPRRGQFVTAGGTVQAPVLRLNALTIDRYGVSPIDAGILDLEDLPGIDGLLGMNFLKQFRFTIDQQQGILHLSPKPE